MSEISGSIKTKVLVGTRELITNGVVHLTNADTVKVMIDNLSFLFHFLTDENDRSARYSTEICDDHLKINLFNHVNSLGEGLFEPLSVATYHGKELSLTYLTSTLNQDAGLRRFEYAFYVGEKAK